MDCRPALHTRIVALTNFPVFLISVAAAVLLSRAVTVNQVLLFYGMNGVGIPLFWYWIGTRIDRRLRRERVATPA